MVRITIVLLAALTFSLFGVALRVVFGRSAETPWPTILMVVVGAAISCLHLHLLWTVALDPGNIVTGAGLYLLACGLFLWTARSVRGRDFKLAYTPEIPPAVYSGGPYRWLRHPFYLSYTLAWCAGVAALSDARLLLTPAIMLGFYVAAAWREERQMLRGPAAEQYRVYRRQTGVLLPRWRTPLRQWS